MTLLEHINDDIVKLEQESERLKAALYRILGHLDYARAVKAKIADTKEGTNNDQPGSTTEQMRPDDHADA